MKNAEGVAEQIPLVHLAKYTNALPARTAKPPPKNLTGLYLGVHQTGGATSPRPGNVVLPLSRGRGMPSRRVHTPTEAGRYRKVELLRSKEEKRGFSGNPLKRKKLNGATQTTALGPAVTGQQNPSPDVWDYTSGLSSARAKTPRHFTTTTNSGVTHLENLTATGTANEALPQGSVAPPTSEPRPSTVTTPNTNELLVNQVHKLSLQDQDLEGLVDCYKKVCKGNIEALQALMPQRRSHQQSPSHQDRPQYTGYTGFSVKSYRNPNKAEIIADFPPPLDSRPRTVAASVQRPLVPSPYFYKAYSPTTHRQDRQSSAHADLISIHDRRMVIPASVGAGQISQSLRRKRQVHTSPRPNSPLDVTVLQPQTKEQPFVPNIASKAKAVPVQENPSTVSEEGRIHIEAASVTSHRNSQADDRSNVMAQQHPLARNSSATDIMIGLEDEAGKEIEIEIDEADENITKEEEVIPVVPKGRRVSITERVLKSKNSEIQMAAFNVTAQYRKQQLAELLDEHAQLVSQVESMECDRADDKENSSQTNSDSSH